MSSEVLIRIVSARCDIVTAVEYGHCGAEDRSVGNGSGAGPVKICAVTA